jgi:predicted transcriptional regulator
MDNLEQLKLEVIDYIHKNPAFVYKDIANKFEIDVQYVRKMCAAMVHQKILPGELLKFRKEHKLRQDFLSLMNGTSFTVNEFAEFSGKCPQACYIHLTNLVNRGTLEVVKLDRKNWYTEVNR